MAKIAIYHNCLPQKISTDDVNLYLYSILKCENRPSESYLKFILNGLRYVYKMYGLDNLRVALPKLKSRSTLPIILSRPEIKRLISAATTRKQHILLLLLYGCGLRCAEASKIKLADIDFDRRSLYIRNGKGGRQRYVPISIILMDAIVAYLQHNDPAEYLLEVSRKNTSMIDSSLSSNTISAYVRNALLKANIKKKVSAHSLRHTFATHLLEDGLDIVTIQDLLGHQNIRTTMVYLHIAQCHRSHAFSPLDTLYRKRIEFEVYHRFPNCVLPMQHNLFLAEFN